MGTPQIAVGPSGETTWKATAEVFGKTTPNAANQITMNLRFPGQYYDAETKTHYNYFRDYNPAIGRYVQRDPIGLRGGINTYGYVVGNSLRYYDPQGKLAQFLIVGGAIGLVIIGGWRYGQQSQQQTGDNGDGFNLGGQGSTGSSEGSSGGSKDTLPPPPIVIPTDKTSPLAKDCPAEKCPPCKTTSGRVVPVGTIGHRPLDVIPLSKKQHGVYGPHYNIYRANQSPIDCRCFWQPLGAVYPGDLPSGAIEIESFVN